MEDDDDIDIYGDLTNFGEKTNDDCSESTLELKNKCVDLEDKVASLQKELENLRTIKNTLEINLSSLIKTAKTEISRKDRMITELRAELENTLFRRNNYRIPKANHNSNNSKIVPNVHTDKCENIIRNNNPIQKVQASETNVNDNNEFTYIPSGNTVQYENDNDDDNDSQDETPQCNKFTSTVYGERLKRKLMEEKKLENLQKEPDKLVTSTNVNTEIKSDLEINSNSIRKDNKENQYQEVSRGIEIDGNSAKKSLKRSNDEIFDEHYDRRKKLNNYESEKICTKDNLNSNHINSSKSYETICKKNNYRLEPIEIRSEVLNRKQDVEPIIENNIDDFRDNYRDRYCKRRSSSRSASRDNNYSDRRKNSNSKYRESNWRYDNDRSDHYRSSSDRNIQNKYDSHRDSRSKNSVTYNGRIDLRDQIEHHRKYRNDRSTDRRFNKDRDNKDSYKSRERSGGSQNNHNDSHYKNNSREHDKRYLDRSKSKIENFNDKNKDSINVNKSETQLSLKVNENLVIENEERIMTDSLEDGEIVGSPKSKPIKNMPNNELNDDTVIKVLDNHLLNTLSVETSELESANCNSPKLIFTSPQEEKIENIEAFIRNFTFHEVSNNILPMDKNDVVDDLINTTKHIAKTLEFDTNNSNINECPTKKDDTLENISEKCINHNKKKQQEHSSGSISSSTITEVKENKTNTTSKPKIVKIETISINNVSTSYADILSKYIRKKRKSCSSDTDPVIPEKNSCVVLEATDVNNVEESDNKISKKSILSVCPQIQQVNAMNSTVENNVEKISSVLIQAPLTDNETISNNPSNVNEILDNVIDKNNINTIEVVDAKIDKLNCVVQLTDVKSQNDCSELALEKITKENDNNADKNEKLTGISAMPISQQSNCNYTSVQDNCTPVNNETRSTVEQTVELQNKIIASETTKNESVQCETAKNLTNSSENIYKSEFQDNNLENSRNKIDCKKSLSISQSNEKKIVVARRKKRPVQLTNSSSSLTVVSSAYNCNNNNRIYKSKMRKPMTLSDT